MTSVNHPQAALMTVGEVGYFGLKMLSDPHDVIHDPLGTGEHEMVDSLQNVVRTVRKQHQEGVVDVAAAERADPRDLAGTIEMLGDLMI